MKEKKKKIKMMVERGGAVGFKAMLPGLIYYVIFFVIPIAYLIRNSFNRYSFTELIEETFTLENYTTFFGDPYNVGIFTGSFFMAIGIVLITIVLAYPLAYLLARVPSKLTPLLSGIVYLPLLCSAVVTAFGWLTLLSDSGIINQTLMALGIVDEPVRLMYTRLGVVIAMTQAQLPYMVNSIRAVLQSIDRFVEESAQTLGANWANTFFRITLPLSLPGIASGSLLVFVGTISAYVTPMMIGGGRVNTLASIIYRQTKVLVNWPLAGAISVVLLIVASLALFAYNKALESRLLGGGGRR